LEVEVQVSRNEADIMREKITGLTERAAMAGARAIEIERRADDLNAELTRVNEQNTGLVKALTDLAGEKKPR
jgi:predicted  nucleic acid-binding Zn-ribbon protein